MNAYHERIRRLIAYHGSAFAALDAARAWPASTSARLLKNHPTASEMEENRRIVDILEGMVERRVSA